jgi:hypothetical protein
VRVSSQRPPRRTAEGAAALAADPRWRFLAALYPVLRARDVAAFRRVLADAEELLGDITWLADKPDDWLAGMMADMLREPRRFGFPRWPALAEGGESAAGAAAPPVARGAATAADSAPRVGGERLDDTAHQLSVAERAPVAAANGVEAPAAADRPAPRADEPPAPAVLNPPLPGFGLPARPPTTARRPRGPRRGRPTAAEQLTLW